MTRTNSIRCSCYHNMAMRYNNLVVHIVIIPTLTLDASLVHLMLMQVLDLFKSLGGPMRIVFVEFRPSFQQVLLPYRCDLTLTHELFTTRRNLRVF
ncbi:hypothetical protein ABKN59_009285 [Abortiporus biennis]